MFIELLYEGEQLKILSVKAVALSFQTYGLRARTVYSRLKILIYSLHQSQFYKNIPQRIRILYMPVVTFRKESYEGEPEGTVEPAASCVL